MRRDRIARALRAAPKRLLPAPVEHAARRAARLLISEKRQAFRTLKRRFGPRDGGQAERPCHLEGLFIDWQGDVYPCCKVSGVQFLKIGNVREPDIFERLRDCKGPCWCDRFRLRPSRPEEEKSFGLLNISVSLACQSKCAMCCAGAPDWQGEYDLYDILTEWIARLAPRKVVVQGGEVLVQPKTMAWLGAIHASYPGVLLGLISNGNVGADRAAEVGGLFDSVTISFPAFQPETYKRTTMLDVTRSVAFAEELLRQGKSTVWLKYLMTPLNVHETPLFLEWALRSRPGRVILAQAAVRGYINSDTWDSFWQKILDRTADEIRKVLDSNASIWEDGGPEIYWDPGARELLGLQDLEQTMHEA